jgi:hypothetical protein
MGRVALHTGFLWRNLRERDHLEYTGVDGKIILKCIFRKYDWGMDWIDMAQNTDRWWDLVNAVINFLVPYNKGNFLTS